MKVPQMFTSSGEMPAKPNRRNSSCSWLRTKAPPYWCRRTKSVSLSSSDYSFLDKPGLYQAQAFYEYHAPNEGVQPNQSLATDKERSALFSGTLRSEPVRITVAVPHSP